MRGACRGYLRACALLLLAVGKGTLRPVEGQLLPLPEVVNASTTGPLHRQLSQPEVFEDVCAFFQTGLGSETDEMHWGRTNLCSIPEGARWAERAAARCYSCLSDEEAHNNLCQAAPTLLIHQYLNRLDPDNPQGNLLSLKAYLMTQDLVRTRLILWTDDTELILTNSTRPFFAGFPQNIDVQRFDYAAEVVGTMLEGHAYFGLEQAVKASLPPDKPASYSDLVRYILLHNYGGLWIDNDVVLMRDVYPITVLVGYQFIMRWTNAHVMYMHKRSPLAQRILRTVMALPLNHHRFREDLVDKVCKPNGYFEVVDFQNQTDVWAFCVLRLVARHNNSGPDPLDILYDQPLGWWDSDWPGSHSMEGCFKNDDLVDDAYFEEYVAQSMALHTRYPGHSGHTPVRGSPLGRVLDIVDGTMRRCNSTACIPQQAVPLLSYRGADDNPLPIRSSGAAGRAQQVKRDVLLGGNPQVGVPRDASLHAAQHVGTEVADVAQLARDVQHSGQGSWLADSLPWTRTGVGAADDDAEVARLVHHSAQRAAHHGSKWIASSGHQQ